MTIFIFPPFSKNIDFNSQYGLKPNVVLRLGVSFDYGSATIAQSQTRTLIVSELVHEGVMEG